MYVCTYMHVYMYIFLNVDMNMGYSIGFKPHPKRRDIAEHICCGKTLTFIIKRK